MVSGHSKSTGIPRVDELSTGPSGFGVSHAQILRLDPKHTLTVLNQMDPSNYPNFYQILTKTVLN